MQGALLLLVLFGVVALLIGFSRWLAHRPLAAAGNVVAGVVLLLLAHSAWPVASHLSTYERLPDQGGLLAQVHVERTGPRAWRLTLTRLPDGRVQVFELQGDQWRLEARTLAWLGRAASVGLPDGVRLERLSGRKLHAAVATGADGPPDTGAGRATEFALVDAIEPGEDIWSQARTQGRWWSDSLEGKRVYGPWRPLADGARFEVRLDRTPGSADARLDARAANEAAAKAMR